MSRAKTRTTPRSTAATTTITTAAPPLALAPLALLVLALAAAGGCTGVNEDFCDTDTPCAAGKRCHLATRTCMPIDAATGDSAGDAPTADGGDASGGGDGGGDGLTKLADGDKCQSGAQCQSGFCVDGVCCESLCEGLCRSCNASGNLGKCTLAVKDQDPRGDCAGSASACKGACDGKGACTFPDLTTSCGTPTCSSGERTVKSCNGKGGCDTTKTSCGGYACGSGDCKTTCGGSGDCHGTAQCVNKACVAQLALGSACGSNDQACASKLCTDGVCCSVRTCPVCKKCGAGGACVNGPDKVGCGAVSCSGSTLSTPQCSAGVCQPATSSCGRYVCNSGGTACRTTCDSNDSNCTAGNYCDGVSCQAKLGLGAQCSRDGECASNRKCVDNVCCSVADCGACKACGLGTGTCQALPDGPAPSGDCPGHPNCNPNVCKGGQCDYGVNQTCDQQCSGSTYTRSRCSSSGACVAQTPTSCSPYVCGSTACRTDCSGDGHCVTASVCDMTGAHTSGTGFCVDTAKIEDVANGGNLTTAIGAALSGSKTHLRMLGTVYSQPIVVTGAWKLTFIGKSGGGASIIEGPLTSGSNTVQIDDPGAEIAFQNVTIRNGGVGTGGTLYGQPDSNGDGIHCFAGKVTVVDSTIAGNESFGIRATSCAVTVRRTHIRDNAFGGIYHRIDAPLVVTNSRIVRNRRGVSASTPSVLIGYGIWHQPSGGVSYVPVHESLVVAENGQGANAGVNGGGISCNSSSATIKNCIVYDNDTDASSVDTLSDNLLNCSNVTYTSYSGSTTVSGTGNQRNTDCGLDSKHAAGTACQNNGGATLLFFDIDRGPRVKGGTVDRGAYEVN